MNAKKIFYSGPVHFRYSVKQLVAGFDVSGSIQNLPDGRVELIVQGDAGEVEIFLREVECSHLNGLIMQREVVEMTPDLDMKGFSIIR